MGDEKKVFVIGIDGAPPEYVLGEWLDDLPNIKKVLNSGAYARLNSTIPPLSAVAWASLSTGKTPSDLGLFEYVYRKNNSYTDLGVISSKNVEEKTFWQIASEYGKKSIVCLVPLTWPIKPFNGICVSGFMTPSTTRNFTYPEEIGKEVDELFGSKFRILSEFRKPEKEEIIERAYENTSMHFELMKHLIKNKEWDLFFGVIAESDSMNHNFLKYVDIGHREYDPSSKFRNSLKEYYSFVDGKIGELIALLDKDTKIIILSDHGIKRMHNRVNLSDWLIKEGYLVLNEKVDERKKLDMNMINWEKTIAWAICAFEGQIFINLEGREPKGIVKQEELEKLLNEMEIKLKKITGDRYETLDTKIFMKKRDFSGKRDDKAPDMLIYFDNLQYGCNCSLVGNKTLWSPQTAIGSDDAGHSEQGIFIIKNGVQKGNIEEVDILEVSPIILKELGIEEQ